MLQLILHGIGDYFTQNDWMALNKKNAGRKGFIACLIHCILYSLPFLFIGSWKAVLVIFITHFVIDRTNIVAYFIALKNGMWTVIAKDKKHGLPYAKMGLDISNFGFGLDRPFAISIWLYIICDNLCHIICNYVALKYL